MVFDPVFLTEPEVRTNDYVRLPLDPGAWLYACDDGEQVLDRPPDSVPNYLFGKQPFAREYSERYKLPFAASLPGASSMYPEFAAWAMKATDSDALALLQPAPGRPNETSKALDPEPRDGEVHVFPLRDGVYLLVGDGSNIVVQAGEQGAFVVDTGEGKLAEKVVAAVGSSHPNPSSSSRIPVFMPTIPAATSRSARLVPT